MKKTEVNGHLFTPNLEDDDEEVSYQSSGDGNISAFVPDYSQYNSEDSVKFITPMTDYIDFNGKIETI